MEEEYSGNRIIRYRSSILLGMFMLIVVLLMIFLITVFRTTLSDGHTGDRFTAIENRAMRGKILSADGYTLAYSQKHYRAEINTRSIDPKKMDLFINLFSIYSGVSKEKLKRRFINRNGKAIHGRIMLCNNIDVRLASDLKSLGYKMSKMKIFRPLNKSKPHLVMGLDVIEDCESRYFPHQKTFSPLLGYVQTKEKENYKAPSAIKGLEHSYNSYLLPEKNGLIKGKRDVFGTVLRTGESNKVARRDGMNVHLNITLDFQKSIEKITTYMKNQVGAEEILVSVMDSETGKILALASSERFNPDKIQQRDVKSLNPNFSEYLYEPGSVIKPLTLAIALDAGKVTLTDKFKLGGKHKVTDKYTITDDDYFKYLYPRGIIVYSSNIGIAKIAWRLTGKELYDGLRTFGLGQKSGIDFSTELEGKIKAPYLLEYPTYSGNTAYGYSMFTNFMQINKAYGAFNNNGIAVTPKLVDRLTDNNNRVYAVERDTPPIQACSAETANTIHNILGAVVEIGTGTAAQYDGLEVGGKTGTAHIAYKGRYIEEYHSSFYGFANDELGNKFTIGVLVIRPKKVYFASQTAAPTFFKVVKKMVEYNYLTPNKELAKKHLKKRSKVREQKRNAYLRKIESYNKKQEKLKSEQLLELE
ncbi:MAG: penicillin-binding protein 2 [Sulfurovaceae bacterium]|nr:penicillin-binding protein 2 [Sulfurovaceae bacterium]